MCSDTRKEQNMSNTTSITSRSIEVLYLSSKLCNSELRANIQYELQALHIVMENNFYSFYLPSTSVTENGVFSNLVNCIRLLDNPLTSY